MLGFSRAHTDHDPPRATTLLPGSTSAPELKLAAWNRKWLTTAALTCLTTHSKRPADIDLLRRYATELNSDVIAIEEVDGPAIAARVFPPDQYPAHMSHDQVVQRVGIVVRRGIPAA